ncbi:MAG: hypothetical protein RJA16_1175 [Planctomycetota bacterium]
MPTDPAEIDLLILLGSLAAGCLGALVGLGGGIVLVPMLTLVFGVDVKTAMGASLVAVIGTSTGAAALRGSSRLSNQRVGIALELAATLGAIAGAAMMTLVHPALLLVFFGGALLLTAALSVGRKAEPDPASLAPNPLAQRLSLDAPLPESPGEHRTEPAAVYHVQNPAAGFTTMLFAGVLSGLLGIGSGVLKMLAMDTFMKIPFRVSTHGIIDPKVAGPALLGIVPGALLGSWLVTFVPIGPLRKLFLVVLVAIAAQMLVKGVRELDHEHPNTRVSSSESESKIHSAPPRETTEGDAR